MAPLSTDQWSLGLDEGTHQPQLSASGTWNNNLSLANSNRVCDAGKEILMTPCGSYESDRSAQNEPSPGMTCTTPAPSLHQEEHTDRFVQCSWWKPFFGDTRKDTGLSNRRTRLLTSPELAKLPK